MLSELFGPPISIYLAADAVADGTFVQANPDTVKEAGVNIPLVFTKAAYADTVAWDGQAQGAYQDEEGRLWDVLMTFRAAARQAAANPGERYAFELLRIPPGSTSAQLTTLHVVAQAFDQTSGCFTVLLPTED